MRRDPSRVKAVRKCLASRLKCAERTSAARGLFDVGGEGAEDPVELELGPVAGDEEDEVGEVGLDPGGGISWGILSAWDLGRRRF
jgi:hypothetical protein